MSVNENLYKASKLLGVSYGSLQRFPDNVQNSMTALIDVIDVKTQEDAATAFDELQGLWLSAIIDDSISEISKVSGISYDTLKILPEQTKQQIIYEYTMDNNIAAVYRITQAALSVIDLKNVSKLLDIPLYELEKLPVSIQEELCGIYSMEYEITEDKELVSSMKTILQSA